MQNPKPVSASIDDVTIVIVAFNSAKILDRCLRSLPNGIKTIVVDNASADESSAIATAADCDLVSLAENKGYGSAANRGIEASDSKYVFLLNPDIILSQNCIETLIETAQYIPDAAMFGPQQRSIDGKLLDKGNSLAGLENQDEPEQDAVRQDTQSVDFLVGSALFMDRSAFNSVGGFDENIFLFYEENDLCDRFILSGYQIILVKDAEAVHHIGSSTSNVEELERKKRWHMAWSRQYYLRKNNKPSRALWLVLVNGLKLSIAYITRNRKKIPRYNGNLWGTIDYLRGINSQDRKMS